MKKYETGLLKIYRISVSPDVLKDGIQKSRDVSFYRQRRIDTKQYYSTTSNIT